MPDKASVLADVCRALTAGNSVAAAEALRSQYGFLAVPVSGRKYGPAESTPVFVRDGFVDRYSGTRLIFPGALRLLSHLLPVEFPYHPNWRTDQTHPAYWELTATIDHLVPVSRGGADSESNWLTTSMLRNSAKANWTIEEAPIEKMRRSVRTAACARSSTVRMSPHVQLPG